MKMLVSGMGAIALVSMVLLTQLAVALGTANGNDFGSLCEFWTTASKRPSVAQMQEMLKRARPDEKIGSVSASKMLKMDHIALQYCKLEELNKRNEFCAKEVVDEDLERYCDYRFEQLVKFCADNLKKVVHREIDPKLSDELYSAYGAQAEDYVPRLERISTSLAKYFKDDGYYYDDGERYLQCEEFNRQFEPVRVILEYADIEFLQLAEAKGVVQEFVVWEFCKAMLNEFVELDSDSESDTEED